MRYLIIAIALVLAACGGPSGATGAPGPSATAEAEPTPTPALARTPTPTLRGTPTPEPVSAEVVYQLFLAAFEANAMPLLRNDIASAIESDYFFVDSVDRVGLDPGANMITFAMTIAFGGVYERDAQVWQDDTWELVRDFGRLIWVPFREGMTGTEFEPDWPRWTPALRIDGNGGRLTVSCPGTLINRIADRDATQADYANECTFGN